MPPSNRSIQAILVPQGAEYRAVCQGLRDANLSLPVLPILVGAAPLRHQLEIWKQGKALEQILLMGLCGSLSPDCVMGDLVLYQSCTNQSQETYSCTIDQMESLRSLQGIRQVQSLTADRVISTASEKRQLGETYAAQVVDMEGAIVLQSLTPTGISVAMLRVVSDGCDRNIPDLNRALKPDGSLNAFALALAFCKEPIAAAHLIRGSLRGLKMLQHTTAALFTELST
jgi:Phosphorylase superfamily